MFHVVVIKIASIYYFTKIVLLQNTNFFFDVSINISTTSLKWHDHLIGSPVLEGRWCQQGHETIKLQVNTEGFFTRRNTALIDRHKTAADIRRLPVGESTRYLENGVSLMDGCLLLVVEQISYLCYTDA